MEKVERTAFSVKYQICAKDVSSEYQHVHHADILKILEHARLRLLEELGCPNESLIARGFLSVITRVLIHYKRELVPGAVTVTCENGRITGKRLLLEQRVVNQRNKDAVSAELELQFMSARTRRSVPVPDEFRQRFCKVLGASAAGG